MLKQLDRPSNCAPANTSFLCQRPETWQSLFRFQLPGTDLLAKVFRDFEEKMIRGATLAGDAHGRSHPRSLNRDATGRPDLWCCLSPISF